MTQRTAFMNAHLIDPASGLETPGNLLVERLHRRPGTPPVQ